MINLLKQILQDGMEISEVKKVSGKTLFTFTYKGMKKEKCSIPNVVAYGKEKAWCKSTINTIVSDLYMDAGDMKEAAAWHKGERWNADSSDKIGADLSQQLKHLIEKYEKYIDEDKEEKLDQYGRGRHDDLLAVIAELKEIASNEK